MNTPELAAIAPAPQLSFYDYASDVKRQLEELRRRREVFKSEGTLQLYASPRDTVRYWKEFCTLSYGFGRQTGKTYAIRQLAGVDDVVIHINRNYREAFMGQYPDTPTVNITVPELRAAADLGMSIGSPRKVFVDGAYWLPTGVTLDRIFRWVQSSVKDGHRDIDFLLVS